MGTNRESAGKRRQSRRASWRLPTQASLEAPSTWRLEPTRWIHCCLTQQHNPRERRCHSPHFPEGETEPRVARGYPERPSTVSPSSPPAPQAAACPGPQVAPSPGGLAAGPSSQTISSHQLQAPPGATSTAPKPPASPLRLPTTSLAHLSRESPRNRGPADPSPAMTPMTPASNQPRG